MRKHFKMTAILAAAAFALVLTGLALQTTADTAKDPVCGMSVKTAEAKYTYEYKGAKYYFCSQGCKDAFAKEPEKYLAASKPAGMMGGMHGQMPHMKAGEQAGCNMENCPMMLADVEKKVQNTKDGVVVTLTSKNPETVKKLQDHAAKMSEAKKLPGGHGEAGCPMAADCPMKKK